LKKEKKRINLSKLSKKKKSGEKQESYGKEYANQEEKGKRETLRNTTAPQRSPPTPKEDRYQPKKKKKLSRRI